MKAVLIMIKKNNKLITSLREFKEVFQITKNSPRSKKQINKIFESDCEILKFNNKYFCSSTDAIGEEISIELYKDPFLWGWMTVMSSISDLAASGAKPLGLLISTQWKFSTKNSLKNSFYRGVNAALKAGGVDLLGGDSGYSRDHVMSSTIIGISNIKPLTRVGAKPGDYVVIVGKKKMGVGPCIAFRFLLKQKLANFPESLYRPSPSPKLLQKLCPLTRASIDTSDGLASCLNIISKLNKVGFKLKWNDSLIHPKALSFCLKNKIHPLMLWMSDHGDFQSLIFISPDKIKTALKTSSELVIIGRCTPLSKQYLVTYENNSIELPFDQVSNCTRDANKIFDSVKKLNSYFWKMTP